MRSMLRFSRTAWSRMEADGTRLGWAWVVAAADRQGEVTILDPAHARHGSERKALSERGHLVPRSIAPN